MINNTSVENNHITNGNLATVYPITFQGATDDNGLPMLKVTLVTADESSHRELEYNVDYVLSYDEVQENNSESLNEPHLNGIKLLNQEDATSGNKLSIIRNTPFVQPIDFQVGRIDPEQVEKEADLSVLRDQELRNQMTKDEAILADHEERITVAEEDIDNIEDTLTGHIDDHDNPHQTSVANLTDTEISGPSLGQFLQFNGTKWVNVTSSATIFWGDILGTITNQTDLMNTFVKKAGDTMTGDLSFQYNSTYPLLRIIQSGQDTNHLRFINNNSAGQSVSFDLSQAAVHPLVTGRGHIGTSSIHFGDAHIDEIYTPAINNGYTISVPVTNAADSFALESEITTINGKIPAQATTTNQLADKSFVNSSIATNTADFKGTYNSLAELEAVTADNNDYGFVVSVDTAGNTVYSRYKFNGTSWAFEYNLNNSSFTSNQWASINSGVTSNDVSLARSALQPGAVGDGTITINQGGTTKGTFTTNQNGNTTIELDAGGAGSYHPDLFDFKWADHQLDDIQWLCADTFSWQSGSVYQAAFWDLFYDMQVSTYWYSSGGPAYTKSRTPAVGDAVYLNSDLTTQIGTVEAYDDVNDEITVSGDTYSYMSNTYVTPTTETVAGYSVSVYTGHSGKKIVSASDETNVANIYTATGVAWYYIIDIPNKRFKLPRTKFAFTGLRDTVGNYVAAGLPDHSHTYTMSTGAVLRGSGSYGALTSDRTTFDSGNASDSNAIYGASTTVQPPATQMYLYFYVGEFTQTALENTAGITAETLNDKVDVGHQVIEFQAPTAGNNYTWYRKYADGWVEQGGQVTQATTSQQALVFPVEMSDANYQVLSSVVDDNLSNYVFCVQVKNKTVTGFDTQVWGSCQGGTSTSGYNFVWEVKGMAA